ncbi:hypothetical protein [Serpentinicella alkaliphila]|uniref:Uncharacterized protein n=1 Tax=Serpentinicella alkaliphila TaxID=1734049 RepID=A0A4R2T0C0_9FIRM|nr:hypothetical protein [Serpentinicella alkaliphila]QUH25848.1 hypothetical protein HZR23_08940 [Serpentinicella alkaliphila]TCP95305.1 hypothetical protein EDD79_106111 [Serpentinicella alkaliphila]
MDISNIFTVGSILVATVGIGAIYYYYKKRNLEKFFNQVYEETRKVPKQKRNSFILLMFKESLTASVNKSKNPNFTSKFQNPKYLEIQLVQMSHILKDSSKVKDKVMKRSLGLLNNYYVWEKAKFDKEKKEIQSKAS